MPRHAFETVPLSGSSALTALWPVDGLPPHVAPARTARGRFADRVDAHRRAGWPRWAGTPGAIRCWARSPAAAWASCSRPATPTWAATWPLKVLLDQHRDDQDVVRRFVEEAQIGGQLQHPGIVPVHELGARRPAAVLRHEAGQGPDPGRALGRTAAVRAADLPRFLAIFESICQTVAYAHARGVIHRDLKPANVMVGSFGEVQVMDWGLAKVLPRGRRRRRGEGNAA